MIYRFPYDDLEPLALSDTHSPRVYAPREIGAGDQAAVIRRAIADPIGMDSLTAGLGAGSRVLVLVDDMSRPTPAHLIVPELLAELARAKVSERNIKFLIALGTHRPMTPDEIVRKLGASVAERFEVMNHQWDNPSELHDYGTLEDGAHAVLSRHLREADLVIGVGGIAPHPAAGFSGGGKIVAPGVATDEAVGEFHWRSVQYPQRQVLGVRDNPMRRRIDEIARLGSLGAIVNVIQDGAARVVHAVAGEPVQAHRAGCRLAMEVFGVPVETAGPGDIVIADTHPLDQDLWQGVKAMCAMDVMTADGAAVILVTPAPEGVAPQHPGIARYGYRTLEQARELLEAGLIDKVTAHNMVQGGRLVRRTRAFIVSPGIDDAQARALGFRRCPTPKAALEAAVAIQGPSARVLVLRMGGEICPIP